MVKGIYEILTRHLSGHYDEDIIMEIAVFLADGINYNTLASRAKIRRYLHHHVAGWRESAAMAKEISHRFPYMVRN